ncbi:MAG: queuosine precursor transporter, partial [Bacteroidota bacterium]|nr:queuosine precursor transporter [Bacteroidota bacterium]MDX5431293.1 queuosine precursor transporter [Bacteroidota bacterium]MDX5470031.1 queuosine precursor transporter [Bacteroidota bacterium]
GQGLWIIIGSLVAFLIGQLVDVMVFHALKKRTGEKRIWLRATGSTLVSQLIDSFVVLFIAFYIGKLNTPDQWPLTFVLSVCVVNYIYKATMALILTPVLYLAHYAIDRYLGTELSEEMRKEAMTY